MVEAMPQSGATSSQRSPPPESGGFVTVSDAVLVQCCLNSDEAAVRAFVERFQGRIFGVCYRMLGHREDAEDVAQDVFLRVFRHLHRWDSQRPLNPWLMTIAINRCRSFLQQRARLPSPSEFVETAAATDAPDSADLAEELQLGLEQLREEYRACFLLFYQEELSCVEIGTMLDCPEGTVKTWLHRARRELAEFLRRRGVVPDVQSDLQRV
jgi:RNA polymerase sigma-70 factor (ECF subfamily)